MMKKSNKNYTNFDSYEFAEIRPYPVSVSVSGILIRYPYPYPLSVSAIRYPLPAFSTMAFLCNDFYTLGKAIKQTKTMLKMIIPYKVLCCSYLFTLPVQGN